MKYIKILFPVTILLYIWTLYFIYIKTNLIDFLFILLSSTFLFGTIITNLPLIKLLRLKVYDKFSVLNLVSIFSLVAFSFMFSQRLLDNLSCIVYLITIFLSLELLYILHKE